MRFLRRNPPDVPLEKVTTVLFEEYGVEGELTILESERDQNVRVDTAERSYLFKVCNADEDEAVIDLQIQALRHIERVDPGVPVPRALPTLTGATTGSVLSPDGTSHTVRLMSFLDGVVAGSRPEFDTPTFRRNTGTTLARLDNALRGFFHPAARQDHPWDLSRAPRLLEYTRHIENESARRNVVSILERVRDHTLPACATLRHQVIHQDAHTWNLIVDPEAPAEISGIIDFGDIVHGPLINELAIAAYLGGRADSSPETLVDIVAGYDAVVPLEGGDVGVMFDLVLGRMAITLTIGEAGRRCFPMNLPTTGSGRGCRRGSRMPSRPHPMSRAHCSECWGSRLPDAVCRRPNSAKTVSPRWVVIHLTSTRNPFTWSPPRGCGSTVLTESGISTSTTTCQPSDTPTSRPQRHLPTAGNPEHQHPLPVFDRGRVRQRLAATLDHGLGACLFVNSGSEANDVASQIVKHRTGADGLLMMAGAYHGMTQGSLEISDEDFVPQSPNVAAITAPDDFRHASATPADAAEEADGAIGRITDAGHELAGFFVDPAMTSSGIPNVPSGFINAIAGAVRAHGGLVVSDEVQAGFGRTGMMWGYQREGFVPDVVTIGKPVGNGQPLGVVITTRETLDGFMEQTELFSTFGGNPVSCAAGLAVLDVIEDEGLVANAAVVGKYLEDSLIRLAETHSLIGDVRGSGLLVGVELVGDPDQMTPAPVETALLVELMREAGVLVGTEGLHSSILKLRPPLIAHPRHVDLLIEALDASLDEVDRRRV